MEEVLTELGLLAYLDIFREEGFDTWNSIRDIKESDLHTLGVQLDHRQKLQRKIADSRRSSSNSIGKLRVCAK